METKNKEIPTLSTREMEVVVLIKRGHKNKEIAKNLGIHEKSISTYVLRVYNKFEISRDVNVYRFIKILLEKGIKIPY